MIFVCMGRVKVDKRSEESARLLFVGLVTFCHTHNLPTLSELQLFHFKTEKFFLPTTECLKKFKYKCLISFMSF